ncbi:MAG: Crp/Fnr family transcriptional regulator [Saprospiraceae bacterium]|nr:Crp/Fnr family transcriptional regulator [Saprospiraceae bacterium]
MEKEFKHILTRILNAYAPVGSTAVDLIFENGEIETSMKNEIVFHENKYNAFEYFQLEGVSHRFNMDDELQKCTTGIYQNEIVITPHFTRTTNGQSIFSLQALTDCTYLKVPAGTFRDISEQNQQIRMFGRAVVEKEFIRSLNFEVLFRTFNAKDRLLYFRTHYPLLENIIPHTVIASFLGITPVSFSRLRNELAKN